MVELRASLAGRGESGGPAITTRMATRARDDAARPARLAEPKDEEERKALDQAQLLTAKPVLYVCNVDEGDAASLELNGAIGEAPAVLEGRLGAIDVVVQPGDHRAR